MKCCPACGHNLVDDPTPGLTPKQLETLRFLVTYKDERGFYPTVDEIKVAAGLASKSGVIRLLRGLEARGAIRRMPTKARAIEVLYAG